MPQWIPCRPFKKFDLGDGLWSQPDTLFHFLGGQPFIPPRFPFIRQIDAVTACGSAGGANFATTVFPFILRNVSLLGINSNSTPKSIRILAWDGLAHYLHPDKLEAIASAATLSQTMSLSEELLAGKTRGRIVVDVNA